MSAGPVTTHDLDCSNWKSVVWPIQSLPSKWVRLTVAARFTTGNTWEMFTAPYTGSHIVMQYKFYGSNLNYCCWFQTQIFCIVSHLMTQKPLLQECQQWQWNLRIIG